MATIYGNALDQLPLVEVETPFHQSLVDLVQSITIFDPRIASSNLSLEAKGMYLTLLAHKPEGKPRNLTGSGVARLCHIPRRRAGRVLSELIDAGYIAQSKALRRDSKGEMVERVILTLRDSLDTRPVVDNKVVSVELTLLDFAQYAREVGSWDIAILCDFAQFHILAGIFPSAILCDFAHYCIVKGVPTSAILCDFAQNHNLPEIETPAPSPLFPPSSPPSLSPLDSPDPTPSPTPYSPPSSPPGGSLESDSPQGSETARSARVRPTDEPIPAFAGRRPEGQELPVLVPPVKKGKRVIATMVTDAGLLQQAKMDDLMEQEPEAAVATVVQHPTRDLIAAYIEELGFTPPVMGKTLGAAKALTKLKEPCVPEELRQIYRYYKEQGFWKDKMLSLSFLAEHLIQWRMQGRPPAKSELRKAKQAEEMPYRQSQYFTGSKEGDRALHRKVLVKKHGEDSPEVKKYDYDLMLNERDKHLYEEHGVTDDGEVY